MKTTLGVVAVLMCVGLFPAQSLADADVDKLFVQLDLDRDGYISRDEAEAHQDLPGSFDDADDNDDGRLDRQEFLKADIKDE